MSGIIAPSRTLYELADSEDPFDVEYASAIRTYIFELSKEYISWDEYAAERGLELTIDDMEEAWHNGLVHFVPVGTGEDAVIRPAWYNDILDIYEVNEIDDEEPIKIDLKAEDEVIQYAELDEEFEDEGYYFIGYHPN